MPSQFNQTYFQFINESIDKQDRIDALHNLSQQGKEMQITRVEVQELNAAVKQFNDSMSRVEAAVTPRVLAWLKQSIESSDPDSQEYNNAASLLCFGEHVIDWARDFDALLENDN